MSYLLQIPCLRHCLQIGLLVAFAFLRASAWAQDNPISPSTAQKVQAMQEQLKPFDDLMHADSYSKAIALLPPLVEQGNYLAQYQLGMMYQLGQGTMRDKQKAATLCQQAFTPIQAALEEIGTPELLEMMAGFYRYGCGVEEDLQQYLDWGDKAVKSYRIYAKQGDTKAMARILNLFKDSILRSNSALILEYAHLTFNLSEAGNADAILSMGVQVQSSEKSRGLDSNNDSNAIFSLAFQKFFSLAQAGDAYAQKMLGYCYYSGWGVEHNQAQSIEWMKKSAAQGNADAQNNLGMLYERMKMYPEAIEYYKQAAAQGKSDVMYKIAQLYYGGMGAEPNLVEYKKWMSQAAEQGNYFAEMGINDAVNENK